MCGNSSKSIITKTVSDTIPVPKAVLPTRHQVRNAIRKVARTMRTKTATGNTNGSMDSWEFTSKCMVSGDWNKLQAVDYNNAWRLFDKSVKASTFFTKQDGVCGSVKLTLRRTAKL